MRYAGDTAIAGVPGTAAPILLRFADTAGSATGSLLPTGRVCDVIDGIEVSAVADVIDGIQVTCVDNGMPVVVARAADLGLTGYEPVAELAGNDEAGPPGPGAAAGRREADGPRRRHRLSVPKTTLVAPPRDGGTICTRTFIPVRPHTAIGVLGAVSVATALLLPGGVGAELARLPADGHVIDIEHPTGHLQVEVEIDTSP